MGILISKGRGCHNKGTNKAGFICAFVVTPLLKSQRALRVAVVGIAKTKRCPSLLTFFHWFGFPGSGPRQKTMPMAPFSETLTAGPVGLQAYSDRTAEHRPRVDRR